MNALIQTANGAADLWWPYVAHATWQATLLGALLLLVVWVGRRWPSPRRYWFLVLGLLKFAVPPLLWLPTGAFSQFGPAVLAAGATAPVRINAMKTPSTAHVRVESGAGIGEPRVPLVETPVTSEPLATRPAADVTSHAPVGETLVADKMRTAATAAPNSEAPRKTAAELPVVVAARVAPLSWKAWLMLIHSLGMAAVAVWLVRQLGLLRKAAADAEQITIGPLHERLSHLALLLGGLRRAPRLVLGCDAQPPLSFGILRPTIMIPRSVESLSAAELDTILAHELAHHARGDVAMNWLQLLLCAFWWFNPVAWLLHRAIRKVREDCCDDLILARRITTGTAYCETLLRVAAELPRPRPAGVFVGIALRPHPLARRMRRIMDQTLRRTPRLSLGGAAVVFAMAAVCLPGLRSGQATPVSNAAARSKAVVTQRAAQSSEPAGGDTKSPSSQILTGRVLDPQGRPVQGAELWLSNMPSYEKHRVIASGTSAADGSFRLEVPARFTRNAATHGYVLWAYGEGLVWSTKSMSFGLPVEQIEVKLGPQGEASYRILKPDGTPLAGAKVIVGDVKPGWNKPPEELRRRFTATTGPDGKAVIPGLPRESIGSLDIESKPYGNQHVAWYNDAVPAEDITLRPVGHLTGRVTTGEAKHLERLKIKLITAPITQSADLPYWNAVAEIRPDADGRFEAPVLAEGKLLVQVEEPDDFAYRAVAPTGLIVNEGVTTDVTIPLEQAVLVTAQFRDDKSGEPVPGVVASVSRGGAEIARTTDAKGTISLFLLPGTVTLRILTPEPYLWLPGEFRDFSVPAHVAQHELPTVELTRGVTVEGSVLDAGGKPVGSVWLVANWPAGPYGGHVTTSSDTNGRFRLARLHPTAEFTLAAQLNGAQAMEPLVLTADPEKPLVLRVQGKNLVSIRGRIVDEDGKPVGGAQYEIRTMGTPVGNMADVGVAQRGSSEADGTFESTKTLSPGVGYQVRAVVRQVAVGESEWFTPAELDDGRLPDVVYYRSRVPKPAMARRAATRTLGAQVLDRDGKPVAGAKVIAWYAAERIRTTTDADGHVRLADVPDDGAFLFVDAEGFRFHGEFVHPANGLLQVVVSRATEPLASPMWTLPALPSTDQALALAKGRFNAFVQRWVETEGDSMKLELLGALARIDAERALRYADQVQFGEAWMKDSARYWAAHTLLRRDIDEALSVINTLDSNARVNGYRSAADLLPAASRRKLELLAEALVQARSIDAPENRAAQLAVLGERFRALGHTEQGAQILREAQGIAENFPSEARSAYARGAVAEQLCRIDLPAALELIRGIRDAYQFDRHHANVAENIAATQPAEAERVLGMLRDPRQRDDAAARVCYRMTAADPARARRIAQGITAPHRRAYALGMIASALAKTNKSEAAELLEEAYTIVAELVDSGYDPGRDVLYPQAVAVALLPTVEAVDPDLLPEYFWRAVSLRGNVTFGRESRVLGGYGAGGRMRYSDPVLAAFAARYDRGVARLLLEGPGDETLAAGVDNDPDFYFAPLAILDPEGAVRLADSLAEATASQRRRKREAWQDVLGILTRPGGERWQWIRQRQTYLWWPPESGD